MQKSPVIQLAQCVCKTVRRAVWLKCGERKDSSSWDSGHARPYMQIVFQVFWKTVDALKEKSEQTVSFRVDSETCVLALGLDGGRQESLAIVLTWS